VATTFSAQTLGTLVPGVTQAVNGKVWVDKASSRLTKVELPLQNGGVTVSLSDYDAPVTVTPPPTAG
jgi:lipoprotein LprG